MQHTVRQREILSCCNADQEHANHDSILLHLVLITQQSHLKLCAVASARPQVTPTHAGALVGAAVRRAPPGVAHAIVSQDKPWTLSLKHAGALVGAAVRRAPPGAAGAVVVQDELLQLRVRAAAHRLAHCARHAVSMTLKGQGVATCQLRNR